MKYLIFTTLLLSCLMFYIQTQGQEQREDTFKRDYDQLQQIMQEMERLEQFIMDEDNLNKLTREEILKIQDQFTEYEEQMKKITENYKEQNVEVTSSEQQQEL